MAMKSKKRKKSAGKKTTARRKKSAVRKKPSSRPKASRGKKAAARKKKAPRQKTAARKTPRTKPARRPANPSGGPAAFDVSTVSGARGMGSEAGGQSGDTEGLSRAEGADSESVEELLEEGQAFEAGIVSGVENAPDADEGGVRTRQVPEDDVPQEYLDED